MTLPQVKTPPHRRRSVNWSRKPPSSLRGISFVKICFVLVILLQITAVMYVYRYMEKNGSDKKGDNHNISQAKEATIAYAVTLTSCKTNGFENQNYQPFVQGAAVLAHSIRKTSAESKYGYKLYAFVHPDAEYCSGILSKLGYNILIRDTPVDITKIKGEYLRTHVADTGCCGEKEYIKLYSYTLVDHPIVVHLDLDALLLKPFDDLFDAMLDGPNSPARERIKLMFPDAKKSLPSQINAYFTRDYPMIKPGRKDPVGVQGGFLVIRPNLAVFEEYRSIILEGDYEDATGWGRKGYGYYWGDQQIQGLCSYYYDYFHPGEAVELNRCYFNAMADNPKKNGKCLTGEDVCEDCTTKKIDDIYSVHFTFCWKPWLCVYLEKHLPLCHDMHHEWFRTRKDLDETLALERNSDGEMEGANQIANGRFKPELFFGYCTQLGASGFIPFNI